MDKFNRNKYNTHYKKNKMFKEWIIIRYLIIITEKYWLLSENICHINSSKHNSLQRMTESIRRVSL